MEYELSGCLEGGGWRGGVTHDVRVRALQDKLLERGKRLVYTRYWYNFGTSAEPMGGATCRTKTHAP